MWQLSGGGMWWSAHDQTSFRSHLLQYSILFFSSFSGKGEEEIRQKKCISLNGRFSLESLRESRNCPPPLPPSPVLCDRRNGITQQCQKSQRTKKSRNYGHCSAIFFLCCIMCCLLLAPNVIRCVFFSPSLPCKKKKKERADADRKEEKKGAFFLLLKALFLQVILRLFRRREEGAFCRGRKRRR